MWQVGGTASFAAAHERLSQRPNHTMSSLTCIPPTFESLEPRALLAAGAIDSSYSPPFNNVGNSPLAFQSVVHMQFDGKSIHCANINDKQTLWRQNPNGSLDTSFGTRGKVVLNQKDHVGDMTVAPNGKIVVYYATTHKIHVAR